MKRFFAIFALFLLCSALAESQKAFASSAQLRSVCPELWVRVTPTEAENGALSSQVEASSFWQVQESQELSHRVFFQFFPNRIKTMRDVIPANEVNDLLVRAKTYLVWELEKRGLYEHRYLLDFKTLRLHLNLTSEQLEAFNEARRAAELALKKELEKVWFKRYEGLVPLLSGSLYAFGIGESELIASGMARRRHNRKREVEGELADLTLDRLKVEQTELLEDLVQIQSLGLELISLWNENLEQRGALLNSSQDSFSFEFMLFLRDVTGNKDIYDYLETHGNLEAMDLDAEVDKINRLASKIESFIPAPQYRDGLEPREGLGNPNKWRPAEGDALDQLEMQSAVALDLKKIGVRLHDEVFQQIIQMKNLQDLLESGQVDDLMAHWNSIHIDQTLAYIRDSLAEYVSKLSDHFGDQIAGYWITGDELILYFESSLDDLIGAEGPSFDRSGDYGSARVVRLQVEPGPQARSKLETLRLVGEQVSKEVEEYLEAHTAFSRDSVFEISVIDGSDGRRFQVTGQQEILDELAKAQNERELFDGLELIGITPSPGVAEENLSMGSSGQ